jgi:transposase
VSRRKRNGVTPEDRDRIVAMVRGSGRPVTHLAAELGMSDKTLSAWVQQAKRSEIDPDGQLTDAQRQRIVKLEKENALLRRDLDFQKKAAAFFRDLDQSENDSL